MAAKYQYTFRLRSMEPTQAATQAKCASSTHSNFPVSKHIAAALLIIKPGHMRELHWHPNASEWQYYIAGKGRMTVFFPVDNARTMDFQTNDVGYVPSNAPHYFENTGDTDLVVLELFAADEFMDVSLNEWLRRVPSEMLKAHLNIDKQLATTIPPGGEGGSPPARGYVTSSLSGQELCSFCKDSRITIYRANH